MRSNNRQNFVIKLVLQISKFIVFFMTKNYIVKHKNVFLILTLSITDSLLPHAMKILINYT